MSSSSHPAPDAEAVARELLAVIQRLCDAQAVYGRAVFHDDVTPVEVEAFAAARLAYDTAVADEDTLATLCAAVLSGERDRTPKSDAQMLKEHLRGCAECSAGDYCDEGESYGGAVTAAYLYRITESNGCTADAAAIRVAAYRAARSTPAAPPEDTTRADRGQETWDFISERDR